MLPENFLPSNLFFLIHVLILLLKYLPLYFYDQRKIFMIRKMISDLLSARLFKICKNFLKQGLV